MGSEKNKDFYNHKFSESVDYHIHYKDSWYYVHWTQIMRLLRKISDPIILEVGCGTGQLAHYLYDEGYRQYRGFDFSDTAIDIARKRKDMDFFVGDALDPACYQSSFNTVICTEVLEHITDDFRVVRNIPLGTHIIFSVPNFDEVSHVRWFLSDRQIKKRYFRLVDIRDIIRIGNIFIVWGVRSDFSPTLWQRFFATREKVGFASFSKRIRHRVHNFLKLKG